LDTCAIYSEYTFEALGRHDCCALTCTIPTSARPPVLSVTISVEDEQGSGIHHGRSTLISSRLTPDPANTIFIGTRHHTQASSGFFEAFLNSRGIVQRATLTSCTPITHLVPAAGISWLQQVQSVLFDGSAQEENSLLTWVSRTALATILISRETASHFLGFDIASASEPPNHLPLSRILVLCRATPRGYLPIRQLHLREKSIFRTTAAGWFPPHASRYHGRPARVLT
jgi:hypothetical protein